MSNKVITENKVSELIKVKERRVEHQLKKNYKLESKELNNAIAHQTPAWVGNRSEQTFQGQSRFFGVLNSSVPQFRKILFGKTTLYDFSKT